MSDKPVCSKRSVYEVLTTSTDTSVNAPSQALHVGRVTMSVAVVDKDTAASLASNGKLSNIVQAVAASEFPVTTVREQRTADLVFDSSAAAIAILISFGIGCCTDTDSVKRQLKHPVSLVIGFCCQFILMPVVAFGLAMVLPLKKDARFGLLCVACVPGGGLGHIAVIIGDADIPLSLTMNLISVVAMLGTAPLWIFVLGQYFQADPTAILSPRVIPIYNFEIWLASIFFAYATGLVINRFRPVVADAILTWIIKPFLLLASILYITLGVYINMYVFEEIDRFEVMGAVLLPLSGFVLGFALPLLCRQKTAFMKTIALETSSLNCLTVLAALRFSLQQPDADLASTVPIWVMFTIPGLYVGLAILRRFSTTTKKLWNSRNSKKNKINNNTEEEEPKGVTTWPRPLSAAPASPHSPRLSSSLTAPTMRLVAMKK
ncbi:hypothetical protein C0Q70_16974 [Pomacea canaliculata]|uniref:Uncharacterized protein n=1 Tax=Pomacea canaliculata TaxID=400727 RepID=A0A2T7NRA2_POMCA|nr:hypothetical protein C0Q70_16974 [Pomacea canaliculata]